MNKIKSMVTILGILMLMFSLFHYFYMLLEFIKSSIPLSLLPKNIFIEFLHNPLIVLSRIVFIICGIGVLQTKEWARKLTIYLSSLGLLLSIFFIPFMKNIPIWAKLINIIFYGLCYIFFISPKVKEQFK